MITNLRFIIRMLNSSYLENAHIGLNILPNGTRLPKAIKGLKLLRSIVYHIYHTIEYLFVISHIDSKSLTIDRMLKINELKTYEYLFEEGISFDDSDFLFEVASYSSSEILSYILSKSPILRNNQIIELFRYAVLKNNFDNANHFIDFYLQFSPSHLNKAELIVAESTNPLAVPLLEKLTIKGSNSHSLALKESVQVTRSSMKPLMTEFLLRLGADPNHECNADLFLLAIKAGNLEQIISLIQYGIAIDYTNSDLITLSIYHCSTPTIKYLLKIGLLPLHMSTHTCNSL